MSLRGSQEVCTGAQRLAHASDRLHLNQNLKDTARRCAKRQSCLATPSCAYVQFTAGGTSMLPHYHHSRPFRALPGQRHRLRPYNLPKVSLCAPLSLAALRLCPLWHPPLLRHRRHHARRDLARCGRAGLRHAEPILNAGIASLQRGETAYTSNSGTIALRRALSAHLSRRYGVEYDPETELLITVGVSEALYLAVTAILDPGDEVIVPQPCFVSYVPEVIFAGGVAVTLPTYVQDEFQVTGAALEARVTPRTKAILIGYPNNPTGAVLSRERMNEIAQVAEKHDLVVISDEIYDRLVRGGARVLRLAAGDAHAHHPFGGFSKDYAMTGWRIGYVAAPAELLAAMRKVHQYTIMSAPTTGQHAALAALEVGEEHVQRMVAEYDRRRRLIVDGCNALGLDCFEPRGAFYVFPSIARTGMSDDEFAERLLMEEQVAVGAGQRLRRGRRWLRANVLCTVLREDRAGPGAHPPLYAAPRISCVARLPSTSSALEGFKRTTSAPSEAKHRSAGFCWARLDVAIASLEIPTVV